jgi:hypothetical protein
MFRVAILMLAGMLLAACGGGDSPPPSKATHEGTTLLVGGVAYERKPSLGAYVPGELIVKLKVGREQEGMALFQALGLATFERGSMLFLSVKPGFEEQWVAALKGETAIEYVETNAIMYPT